MADIPAGVSGSTLARSPEIDRFLDRVAGVSTEGGNPRVKQIVRRIVGDLFRTIDDFDVQADEFWAAVAYVGSLGTAGEHALLAPGLGFDHYLDLRMDLVEREIGLAGGTPRTIEGPLYVAGAPLAQGFARLDDGSDVGETLYMHGRVLTIDGRPIPGAIVDVWHADTLGRYSFFDPSQTPYNLRRRIETDAGGRYRFRSIVPAGYGCPPDGPTQRLLDLLGRHGQRPAHIHFFASAAGHRQLTTQINIAGDPLVHDDFAFATRDELIPDVVRHDRPTPDAHAAGIEGPFAEIEFDFVLHESGPDLPPDIVNRERASATA